MVDVGKRVAISHLKYLEKKQYLVIAQKTLVITHRQDFICLIAHMMCVIAHKDYFPQYRKYFIFLPAVYNGGGCG